MKNLFYFRFLLVFLLGLGYLITISGCRKEDVSPNNNNNGNNNSLKSPVASFTVDKQVGDEPVTVTFSNNSSGTISSYFWDFGDGVTSSLANPSHTFNSLGKYTVKLTVSNSAGSSYTTKQINVRKIVTLGKMQVGPYWAARTSGGCDFGGPATVHAEAAYMNDNNNIYVKLTMNASTSNSTAFSQSYTLIGSLPAGTKFVSFAQNFVPSMSWDVTPQNHSYASSANTFDSGWFKILGDTNGDDDCNTTFDDSHIYLNDTKAVVRVEAL